MNGFTEFELLHEFDTPLLTNNELISFSNVGEVMPMPLSTLGLSIISPYANKVSDSHKPTSYLQNLYKYFYVSFPVYNHRLTLNILGVSILCRLHCQLHLCNPIYSDNNFHFISEIFRRCGCK